MMQHEPLTEHLAAELVRNLLTGVRP
jgi:hypothetical protein